MSAISGISSLFQGFSPLGFIRTRFVRLGALIRWIGQRLTARGEAAVYSRARQARFDLLERLATKQDGPMSEEDHQKASNFLNSIRVTPDGHDQFIKDALRTSSGGDSIHFEGRRFTAEDPRFKRAYAADLQARGVGPSEFGETEFFAEYLLKKARARCGGDSRWLHILEGVVHQAFSLDITRLSELTAVVVGQYRMSLGVTKGTPTFPRMIDIKLKRDESGEILGVDLEYQIGYRVQDPHCGVIGHFKVDSRMYIDFDDRDRVRVSDGHIAIQAVADNALSFREIQYARTYSQSESLGESIAHWTFWGANIVSFGELERRTISPHLEQIEEYVRHRGDQKIEDIKVRLAQLRRLYRETGQERYKHAAHAMVRSLFEREIIGLDYQAVEAALCRSIESQFADRTVDGDLRMFVRDNGTRPTMKTNVVFKKREGRSYAEYNSKSAYYAGNEAGDERRYFNALQKELHTRYPADESPVRDMVQLLMTQDVTYGFTADLFNKAAGDGFGLPQDVKGAAESSIVVRSDKRITYVLKTLYGLPGMDSQDKHSAGQIAVDVALDLRYEDETWVPRIVKRDIRVIHDRSL